MYFKIVSNVKNMTLGRFWSLTDYDIEKSESQILIKERKVLYGQRTTRTFR